MTHTPLTHVMIEFLDQHLGSYFFDEETGIFTLKIRDALGSVSLRILCEDEACVVRMVSGLPAHVPSHPCLEVLRCANELNPPIRIGMFLLNLEGCSSRLRPTARMDPSSEALPDNFTRLLGTNLQTNFAADPQLMRLFLSEFGFEDTVQRIIDLSREDSGAPRSTDSLPSGWIGLN